MSIAARTTPSRRATINDLYGVEGKAELVNGRIVKMSPVGDRPSRVASNIFHSLRTYEKALMAGKAYTDGVAFLAHLPRRGSFSPDASYYTGAAPANPDDFLPDAPDFAVEVRSKGDYGRAAEKRLKAKLADYFASGTKVVWDVDPIKEIVAVYRADDSRHPTVYKAGEIAEAEPAVPGWRMAVNDIFE